MKFLTILIFAFLWVVGARAQETPVPETPVHETPAPESPDLPPAVPDLSTPAPWHIKAGASLQHYRYAEPGLISHSGMMIGAWVNWWYPTAFYTGVINGDLTSGRLDYNGALCDINSNQCSDYQSKTDDLILKLSHRFSFAVNDRLQLFAGLGYRYLYDKGVGSGFYRRTGNYWTAPLGFSFRQPYPEAQTNFTFDAEWSVFLKGSMESALSEVNPAYSDVKHEQNHGSVVKLTVGYEPDPTEDQPHPWMYYLYYEKWSIDQSDRAELMISGGHSGNFFYEPKNFSETYGLKIGWAY